ncbi:MAG: cytochrome c oxidase subunit 2A [Gemmatimonadales bacterium]
MTDNAPDTEKHPRGTLAVVGLYGLLLLVGWLLFFLLIYLPRGAVSR